MGDSGESISYLSLDWTTPMVRGALTNLLIARGPKDPRQAALVRQAIKYARDG